MTKTKLNFILGVRSVQGTSVLRSIFLLGCEVV